MNNYWSVSDQNGLSAEDLGIQPPIEYLPPTMSTNTKHLDTWVRGLRFGMRLINSGSIYQCLAVLINQQEQQGTQINPDHYASKWVQEAARNPQRYGLDNPPNTHMNLDAARQWVSGCIRMIQNLEPEDIIEFQQSARMHPEAMRAARAITQPRPREPRR